jgi:hypothetical protein
MSRCPRLSTTGYKTTLFLDSYAKKHFFMDNRDNSSMPKTPERTAPAPKVPSPAARRTYQSLYAYNNKAIKINFRARVAAKRTQ